MVTGLAKIGKAASYESRYVRKTVNYPPGTDLFNELLVDWSDYPAADGFGSIKGNSPIYTLILTAQSGQDLDVLEVKLGLDGGLEND